MAATELAIGRALERSRGFARALSDAELWLVGPLLVAGLMAPAVLAPALAIAALFWLVRWVAWGRLTVRTAADLPVAILVLMLPVTLWVTPLPDVTRQQVLWLASGIVVYYTFANWMVSASRERTIVLCLVGAGLSAALIAPVAVTWVTSIKLTVIPETVYNRLPLLAENPIHPNVLAGALVLALPIPLALLLFDGSRMQQWERFAMAGAVASMGVILVLTKSRGALLAGAAAVLLLCLLRWRRGWLVIVFSALLAGFALWRVGLGQLIDKLSATGAIVGGPGRLEIWTRGLYLVRAFPFTGIGMGAFHDVTNRLFPFFLLGPDADIPHAHNLFLQVALDLGIPGLIAWLGLLFIVTFSAWQIYRSGRREGNRWTAGLGAGLLASQVAMMVHGLLDAAVWGAHSALVVWALWGLCAAAYNLRKTPRDDPSARRPGPVA